ncbi:MAG TPA: ADP-forming succinate--CoA ligase subunit beta [Solirubrobacterales bacterium]|nr:ADP-forming succinate--CoA ligase subunit beta [Solirubrobacterales bacterium]
MDLLEYQGKELFARHDLPVPEGSHAKSAEEARAASEVLGYPVAVKAQVLIGGRGKAGGIKIAQDAVQAHEHAGDIIGMDIFGPHGEGPFKVHELWVEAGSDIKAEYYASVILDRSAKKLLIMLSHMGGMDVEAVAESNPEALIKEHVDPINGLSLEAALAIVAKSEIPAEFADQVAAILVKMAEIAQTEDATLIEINPLIVNAAGEVVALDSKTTIDDNSLYRHPELEELAAEIEDPQEAMAKERGLTYVKLDGDIGILGNGAGLCMSTLDVVAQAGGAPANFLDAGGGSKADAIINALEVITSDTKVKAVLFNIFGGITRGDEVAKGIIEAVSKMGIELPIVVRLDGTNSEEGLRLLAEAGLDNLHNESTMLGAAERVVELAGSN